MKHQIMTLCLCAAVFAVQSCSDEEPVKGTPVEPGTEIEFGATLPDEVVSRTYYDDVTNSVWPIYWNWQTGVPKDRIFIYSPEAADGRNQATYEVNATEKTNQAVSISKIGTTGIQSGTSTGSYNFYSMYPASAVDTSTPATNSTIKGCLEASQDVTYDAASSTATAIKMKPDMNNCLMIGTSGPVQLVAGQKVGIKFKPFVSALDITVHGPANSSLADVIVSTVRIVAADNTHYIAGDFSYNFASNQFNMESNEQHTNVSNIIDIPVRDASGKPITLKYGMTLNLQAFVLPNTDVNDLSVVLVNDKSQTLTQKLNATGEQIASANILKVNLGTIETDFKGYDYSIWLSQLDENTYISDISLPGAALAFNTKTNGLGSDMITQYTDLAGLFTAGIRAFQAHIILDGKTPSSIDGGSSFMIATSNGSPTGLTLYNVLTTLMREMEQNHAGEFCVLVLSDYGWGTNADGSSAKAKDFYERLNVITNAPEFKNKLLLGLNSSTTLSQAKDKILIKYQLNFDGSTGSSVSMNSAFDKINTWAPLNGAQIAFNLWTQGAGEGVLYSPMSFANMGTSISVGSSTTTKPPLNITGGDTSSFMYRVGYYKWNTRAWTDGHKLSVWPYTWIDGYWTGNGSITLTSAPTDGRFDRDMWFVYSEQANAGDNTSTVNSNVRSMINAINNTYNASTRNKFYMTYCGGAPNSSDLVTITDRFNNTWLNNISTLAQKPYGWVMLNCVGDRESTLESTGRIISAIIDHNAPTSTFKPGTATPAQAEPQGNNEGMKPAGELF